MTAPQLSFKALRRVVIAAAVGNVIEWYDFYIFGSLATILAVKFFAQGTSGAALIKTVGTFTAGFLIRPFGAFLFGRIGDLVGRKYTFLITLSGMGLSTALIGLVPSYARIGALAGVLLLLLRLIQETPIFQAIKAKGQTATNPWREAFLSENIKYVVIASIVVIGEGVVWYSGQFWAYYFLQQVMKPDVLRPAIITGIALLLATPSLIFFGWLSDRVGRKPIILAGFLLAAVTYYPLYTALGNAANPANPNYAMAIIIVAVMVSYVGMVYGPIGAFLAEYFPARIRYSSVSVPYHIGNGWGGGLVPVITTAAYLSTHSLGNALLYPIIVPSVAFLLSLFLMPETRKISIWQPAEVRAGARG